MHAQVAKMATINTDCTSNRSQNKLLYYVTHDDLLSLNTKTIADYTKCKRAKFEISMWPKCVQKYFKWTKRDTHTQTHTTRPYIDVHCTCIPGIMCTKSVDVYILNVIHRWFFFYGQQFSSFECQILMVFRISVKYNNFHSSLGHNFFYSSCSLNQFHDDFLSMCLFARWFSYWKQSMLIIWLC